MKYMSSSFVGLTGLLLLLLLIATSSLLEMNREKVPAAVQDENINLALRATGHRLLRQAGDSSIRIPPVEHVADQQWRLRLNHPILYDSLPAALHKALQEHGIKRPYNVSLLDCDTDELMLGYSASVYNNGGDVACGGRSQDARCYVLALTILPETGISLAAKIGLLAASLALFAGLAIFWWWNRKKKALQDHTAEQAPLPSNGQLLLGSTLFDPQNQIIRQNDHTLQLTYRESKLLHYFARHPNQLLERDRLLKDVWEDEGIVVGRSLDVFVSRLRKLLQHDPAIRFTTIHGVGYKMQV